MAGRSAILTVTGAVEVAGTGTKAVLERHQPAGINPSVLLLNLDTVAGGAGQLVRFVETTYRLKATARQYKEVNILSEGKIVARATVAYPLSVRAPGVGKPAKKSRRREPTGGTGITLPRTPPLPPRSVDFDLSGSEGGGGGGSGERTLPSRLRILAELAPPVPEPAGQRRRRAIPPTDKTIMRQPTSGGPAATPIIRRTPHMDIPPKPLQPGDTFEVAVYVDQQAARPGEATTDVVVPVKSQVEIQLVVSEHFTVNGSAVTSMTITDAPRSDADRTFSVTVVPANELPTKVPPSLIAQFFYKGRPSGKVSRTATIAGVATTALAPGRARVELQDGVAADLIVVVTAAVANDGRQFFCTVRSHLLDKYKEGVKEPWNLPQATEDIVLSFMERITANAITSSMLLAELKGAGRQLDDASPKVFQQAFWDLVDSGREFKTIAIVSQEPFIPWELMRPYRKVSGKTQSRDALGTEFSIGRWPTPDGISPSQSIPLRDSFVIAPTYSPPLPISADEAKLVADSFAGEIIKPADFDSIKKNLGGQGKTLVHFVCHGQDEETQAEAQAQVIENPDERRTRNRVQVIKLDNSETLNSTQILGIDGIETIFEDMHPFVFLNACEIGRTMPALVGVGGFAKSFLDLGASAVIAPLWSVKDTIAHEIAETFYSRVKAEPNMPFAQIMRDLRQKTYSSGEDTYAAYCFYGDPAACRSTAG